MSTLVITPKHHRLFFLLSCCMAIVIHVAAIYWIKGWTWEWPGLHKTIMENQQHEFPATLIHDEELEKKEHQLSTIFRKIYVQEKNPLLFFSSEEQMNLPEVDTVGNLKVEDGNEWGDVKESSESKNIESFLEFSTKKESPLKTVRKKLKASSNPVVDELFQMTEQIIGLIDNEMALTSEKGITCGEDLPMNILSDEDIPLPEEVLNQEESLKEFFSDRFALSKHSKGPVLSKSASHENLSGLRDAIKVRQKGQGKNGEAKIAGSNDFTLQVEYASKKDAPGYLFRLKLLPKEKASFHRIKHNLFFLIDRSHSIPKERYEASKRAVLEALTLLQEGDTFNILVFDHNIEKLSSINLTWNERNIERAQDFLKNQAHGGLFASTDLYNSLSDIIPEEVAEQEVNTAILLSDGDTFLHPNKQRMAIAKWTKKNKGKVSLYSLACGQGNNLALLDLLSAVNKGLLHFAAYTHELIPTLCEMMQCLQNPIGKDITTSVITSHEQQHITLFPASVRLPNLYEHTPYVVYGSVNQLEDFHLFFQGKYYDKCLDIKQLVSFKEIPETKDATLERAWALQQAYDFYYQYLQTGDPLKLMSARQLLTIYKLPSPL